MTESETTARDDEVPQRLLLVEDDAGLQRQMRWALAPLNVTVAGTRAEAIRQFTAGKPFPVVILDLGLPPDENGATEGLRTLKEILVMAPQTKIIVASGNVDRANAVKAVAAGAFDFFGKPVDIEVVKLIIDRALRMHALEEENQALRQQASTGMVGLISASPQILKIERIIERVAPTDVSILLLGESGSGKEVLARAVHHASNRRAAKFIAINCASIPENLLESELFGHERGAFTGAVKQTIGKFEQADGGTLFLDEIGDMPMSLQAKVLRFLQERKFERVGGRASISVDVRVVSATNQPLAKRIAEGLFREDLYYRLDEVRIDIPPLRERHGDPIVLGHHFLNIFNRAYGRNVQGFAEDAIAAMSAHTWPGNVRELENRMKRAVVMSEGKLITAVDLDLAQVETSERSYDLRTVTGRLEKSLLQEVLAVTGGNISKSAKLLGVSRPQLYHLRRLHNV
ncbi:MAG TPA: PEP-CTERM-box response regulator transcription factor [Aliidongia sp.]|nr:PEP-CTERM-box response regulator transcription factor [Aliidongia sp.]